MKQLKIKDFKWTSCARKTEPRLRKVRSRTKVDINQRSYIQKELMVGMVARLISYPKNENGRKKFSFFFFFF